MDLKKMGVCMDDDSPITLDGEASKAGIGVGADVIDDSAEADMLRILVVRTSLSRVSTTCEWMGQVHGG